jgi:hypothetical protein
VSESKRAITRINGFSVYVFSISVSAILFKLRRIDLVAVHLIAIGALKTPRMAFDAKKIERAHAS